jgi:hypothetical protein
MAGREKHECAVVYNDYLLENALNCNFENYSFIRGYESIWSSKLGIIEAGIGNVIATKYFFDRLYKLINKSDISEVEIEGERDVKGEEIEEEITNIDLPSLNDIHISIGYDSPEFAFLTNSRQGIQKTRKRLTLRRITLKISNLKSSTHDIAKENLEKIANSLFFQIDLAFELPMNLKTQRETTIERNVRMSRKQMLSDTSATISGLKYEYDSEPISLYLYAKESMNMPIFQYLAFYQTVEFYFPIYSSYEAKQKIQSLIKDPRFNPNKDADISKIISAIKISNGGRNIGNERDQLKATIKACTDNSELYSFFSADKNRFEFYSENKWKNISKQKISVNNSNADFISEVSERIYNIRCRIVHSKASESDFDVLLPYSSEVKFLNYDIELIEFISKKVLITSSRPIRV